MNYIHLNKKQSPLPISSENSRKKSYSLEAYKSSVQCEADVSRSAWLPLDQMCTQIMAKDGAGRITVLVYVHWPLGFLAYLLQTRTLII